MTCKSQKNLVFYFLSLSFFCGMYLYAKKALDGFSELKIHSKISKQVHPLPEQLASFYEQPFYYLGKGDQFYVFVSSDYKYVIKFIRFDHLRPTFPISFFKWFPHPYIRARLERAAFLKTRLFHSIECAFTYLKDMTGIVHYQQYPLDKPLLCFDKLNIMHKIKNAPFIVQNYSPKIESIIAGLNQDSLQILIDEIMILQKRRFDLGIDDKDPKITTNFGFKDLKLTQIDIGQFCKINQPFDKKTRIAKVRRILKRIRPQIEAKYPTMGEYIENALERL